MTLAEFKDVMKNPPNVFVLMANDYDLRTLYLKQFCKAHNATPTFVESIDFKSKARFINANQILVLTDDSEILSNPKPEYKPTNRTVVYLYTSIKNIPEKTVEFFEGNVLVIEDLTWAQASNILTKKKLSPSIIEHMKNNLDTPANMRLFGLQVLDLAESLGVSDLDAFNQYFKPWMQSEISEEPGPFCDAILDGDFTFIFTYLEAQRGNEFFVYASIFRWLEQIMRFVSCGKDYWDKGGLVKAVYTNFQGRGLHNIPWVEWVYLYKLGLKFRKQIKVSERDALTGLEVYVCTILRTLLDNRIIIPDTAGTVGVH
jgi:hypothetical protein